MKLVTTLLLISTIAILSCKPKVFTPKPRGYYAIALPKHDYTLFNKAGFPYQFEYPSYGTILKDSTMTQNMKDLQAPPLRYSPRSLAVPHLELLKQDWV